jgi:cation diffusion facilitator CzcD-associated flavoprotein CzcO
MLSNSAVAHQQVAIIGSGFAGVGVAVALKREGIDFVILERRRDLGGTWWDNAYPGCRCDVPSHLYSFSFAPNPEWSHTYSAQPEIWAYLRKVAEDYDIVRHIRFGHEVTDARWDDAGKCWRIETPHGQWTANVLIAANGALSEPSFPDIPGLDGFEGTTFHSATWNREHDLAGERVAVLGTGASSIQLVPQIQPLVGRLHVFQRTAPWVLPHTDRPVRPIERALFRRIPLAQRAVRTGVYWSRELVAIALTKFPRLTAGIGRLGRGHLEKQVSDPDLRQKLTPDYDPGCKRLLLSNDYYPSLTASNVEVVTDAIREVRPHSIITADGTERPVDTIIFGTGFRVTNNPIAGRICGRVGTSLAEGWAATGMRAYRGTTVPDFPNFFLIAGPNTGIGHTSLVFMIEAQIRYVVDCLRMMAARRLATVEVRRPPFEAFNDRLQEKMKRTVWSNGGCVSWYLDDHGRNSTLWPDFTWKYRVAMRHFDPGNYEVTGAGAGAEPAVSRVAAR